VLLPRSAEAEGSTLRPGDLLSDDSGFAAVITTAEVNDLGWRLNAAQAVA
jgi:hypothetical protein